MKSFEHEEMPFEQVVNAADVERSRSHTPLFQVMFSLQNAPMERLTTPGLTFEYLPLQKRMAKFDLTLDMIESQDGMQAELEYNTDLFLPATIEAMASQFQRLLVSIFEQSQTPVASLALHSEAEMNQLMEWSGKATDVSAFLPVHQRIAQTSDKHPDRIALAMGEGCLTYAELMKKVNRLAPSFE